MMSACDFLSRYDNTEVDKKRINFALVFCFFEKLGRSDQHQTLHVFSSKKRFLV